jgi:transketolase
VTLIGAGITLHQALAAADDLSRQGIGARVIDLYSVKPIDAEILRQAAAATGRLLTVEDHWPEGGLGDAVLDVFADAPERPRIVKLAVRIMPGSATPAEQLAAAGIDAAAIAAAARELVAGTAVPVPADVAAR